jgi:arabinan endo-1,5-alpha-L-arabinosidase
VTTTQYLIGLALCSACHAGAHHAIGDASGVDSAPPSDSAVVPADVSPDTGPPALVTLDLNGAISPVHDPSIIDVNGIYYVFNTGEGLPIRSSVDLENWSLAGQVFASPPSWITTTDPGDPNNLWAPDISFWNGLYHLYYAASTFGSNTSCIGHATSPTLPATTWTDLGAVICSGSSDDWNAIDPNVVIDTTGAPWLAFGSFWSGTKLIPLDATGARSGTALYSLSTRTNTAVEAPYIVPHDGYYYLFESVDFCCMGSASTYKIMVGRSSVLQGPYVDADGTALLSDGGTLVLEGDTRWKGPGSSAVLHTGGGDFNVYHSYDADAAGAPTLRIAQLAWVNGWPVSAGP